MRPPQTISVEPSLYGRVVAIQRTRVRCHNFSHVPPNLVIKLDDGAHQCSRWNGNAMSALIVMYVDDKLVLISLYRLNPTVIRQHA